MGCLLCVEEYHSPMDLMVPVQVLTQPVLHRLSVLLWGLKLSVNMVAPSSEG